MIDAVAPYPEYKPVGLPWLHSIPAHWAVKRGKSVFRCIDIRSKAGDEELLTVSAAHGVIPRRTATVTMFKAESYAGYKLCWPGDLVINSLWAWGRGLGVAHHHGIVSSAYGVYRLRDRDAMVPAYIDALVRSDPFNWELHVRSKGIWISRLQLTDESFLDAPFPLPPPAEQAGIVRFLGAVDRKVNRFIRAKRRLIEVLTEQKQAIITHAVTKGLNPHVPLKPSGIDWLGDVPEHWEVVRLRNLVSQVTSGSRGWSRYMADTGPLFIRIGNLTRGSLELDMSDAARLQLPKDASEVHRTRAQANDILVSITAYIGSFAVVPEGIEEAYVSQHVALCRPRPTVHNARWIGYVLLSPIGQAHGRFSLNGGTKDGLSLDDVKNHPVLMPPPDEQDRIVKWIESESAQLNAPIAAIKREIDLIREYRKRLVADVVTGKVDVRAAAAAIPDEAADPGTDQWAGADDPAEADLEPALEGAQTDADGGA